MMRGRGAAVVTSMRAPSEDSRVVTPESSLVTVKRTPLISTDLLVRMLFICACESMQKSSEAGRTMWLPSSGMM